jgi:hypothetical protein
MEVVAVVNMFQNTQTNFLRTVALLALCVLAHPLSPAWAQTVEKSGRAIADQASEVNTLRLNELMTEGVDINTLVTNVDDVRTVLSTVIKLEADRIEEFITNFRPRNEVITVTIYGRPDTPDGWERQGDDGGGDGGSSGSGGSGSGGGSGGACE